MEKKVLVAEVRADRAQQIEGAEARDQIQVASSGKMGCRRLEAAAVDFGY